MCTKERQIVGRYRALLRAERLIDVTDVSGARCLSGERGMATDRDAVAMVSYRTYQGSLLAASSCHAHVFRTV